MAELPKANVTRRAAKASLTRAGKSLSSIIESKRPAPEVRESFVKLQEAYEKLVMKHEDVAQLIELMRNLQRKKDGLRSP